MPEEKLQPSVSQPTSVVSPPETQGEMPPLKKPKALKRKILIGVGIFFGVLALTGSILGAYLVGQKQAQPASQPTPTPEVATPTPDPTASWETYTNTKYGYLIKYPEGSELFEVGETTDISAEEWQAAGLRLNSIVIQILGYENKENLSSQEYAEKYALKFTVSNERTMAINNQLAFQCDYTETRGEKEFPTRRTVIASSSYVVEIYGINLEEQAEFSTHNLILSTFKFLEEGTSQPISIPDDWQEYTATDPDFGVKTTLSLLPEYSFRYTGSEFTIQNDADATELWDYSTSVFRKADTVENFYQGGSRRVWYQDYLEGKFLDEIPILFEEGKIDGVVEHQTGSHTYLELTVSGGINYVGEVEKHFIFVQNGILHIIRPASHKANSAEAQIPDNIGIIFYSLRSERVD